MYTNIDTLPLGKVLQVKQGNSKPKKKAKKSTISKLLDKGYG